MNNKQQTAVEWLIEQMPLGIRKALSENGIDFEQAKEMEKGKMIDFAFNFYYDFSKVAGVPFNLISENRINAEDYYDKTYEDPEQAIIDYNKMEEESEMDDYNNLGND
jgi:hypothetical protein